MQLSLKSFFLGIFLSTSLVFAKTDSKGNFFDCEYLVAIAQNTPHPPPCNRDDKTTTVVYSGTKFEEYKYTYPAGDKGECSVVLYPETSYPDVTVTLTPCATTITSKR